MLTRSPADQCCFTTQHLVHSLPSTPTSLNTNTLFTAPCGTVREEIWLFTPKMVGGSEGCGGFVKEWGAGGASSTEVFFFAQHFVILRIFSPPPFFFFKAIFLETLGHLTSHTHGEWGILRSGVTHSKSVIKHTHTLRGSQGGVVVMLLVQMTNVLRLVFHSSHTST